MARGMVNGERIVSQAGNDAFRESYDRQFGDRKPERGRWVMDPQTKQLVRAEDYHPPARALDAPIIADRIHEGTHFDDGERVRDLGSRRKRREFLRETGLAERSDYGPGWNERAYAKADRERDARVDRAASEAVRKLHHQRKWKE